MYEKLLLVSTFIDIIVQKYHTLDIWLLELQEIWEDLIQPFLNCWEKSLSHPNRDPDSVPGYTLSEPQEIKEDLIQPSKKYPEKIHSFSCGKNQNVIVTP